MAFSNLDIFQVLNSKGWQVCNISFFQSVLAIDLKLNTVYSRYLDFGYLK